MESKFNNKSILKLIFSMALPPIISMIVQSLYAIIDAWFVAQVSEDAFNAVSIVYPLQSIILSIAVGLGIALNGAIARSFGRKDTEKVKEFMIIGVLLTIIHYILIIILSLIIINPFVASNCNSNTSLYATQYIRIISFCSIGLLVQLTFEKILQGHGNMIIPTVVQMAGCILNIILDYVFVLVLGYGVVGAASATVISQCLSGLILFIYVLTNKKYTLSFKHLKLTKENLTEIYKVCIPSTLMMALPSVLIMCLNTMLSSLSQNILSLYLKIQTFVFMPIMGLSQGLRPIIGYFYGAKRGDKIKLVLKNSIVLITIVMVIGVILFNIIPSSLIKIYFDSPEMITEGSKAFKIFSISFIFVGVSFLLTTFYDSIGMGYVGLVINLCRQFIITLVLSYIFVYIMDTGPVGVWSALVIAEIFTAFLGIAFFSYSYKNNEIFMYE